MRSDVTGFPPHSSNGNFPSSLETVSGKGARDENFPVASLLIRKALRPSIMACYHFARVADDIADNPALLPEEKIARLDRIAELIARPGASDPAFPAASHFRSVLDQTGLEGGAHGLDLLRAFRQDAHKARYANWEELIDYCRYSAAPVGRYVLDVHAETKESWASADALCIALQILNHLQDCGADYQRMDRVYLPLDWMEEAHADPKMLDAPALSPELRQVINRCLDGTAQLLLTSEALPGFVKSRRLRLESSMIIAIAWRLVRRLRQQDPLKEAVKLEKFDYFSCLLSAFRRLMQV